MPQRKAALAILQAAPGRVMKSLDGIPQRLTLDETHRVTRLASLISHQAVDRHDARMLQLAGNLGFEQEAAASRRVAGVVVLDAFQGNLAVQFRVERQVNFAGAPLGMETQGTISTRSRGRAGGRGA